MITIIYSPKFLKKLKKISKRDSRLAEEVLDKVAMFKNKDNHTALKVHANKGKLKGYQSFSVNYKIRIIFRYLKTGEVFFITIGDHDAYDK